MSISITFHDELAQRLQLEASERQVTVEELVTRIVDGAVSRSQTNWSAQNQRRLVLIRKSVRQTLTDDEQQELDQLQAALDERFEDFDSALLKQLDLMLDGEK